MRLDRATRRCISSFCVLNIDMLPALINMFKTFYGCNSTPLTVAVPMMSAAMLIGVCFVPAQSGYPKYQSLHVGSPD